MFYVNRVSSFRFEICRGSCEDAKGKFSHQICAVLTVEIDWPNKPFVKTDVEHSLKASDMFEVSAIAKQIETAFETMHIYTDKVIRNKQIKALILTKLKKS